jgi:hypothetical protein
MNTIRAIYPNILISILESYGTKKEDIEKFKKQLKTIK